MSAGRRCCRVHTGVFGGGGGQATLTAKDANESKIYSGSVEKTDPLAVSVSSDSLTNCGALRAFWQAFIADVFCSATVVYSVVEFLAQR